MKITLKETITKEVELILPCWRKTETSYYYITEEYCIEVLSTNDWIYIGTSAGPSVQAINNSKAITYEEFKRVYLEAIDKLNLKIDVDVRYEFQIVEGSVYIDEIVNEKAGRQFRLTAGFNEHNALKEITLWYDNYTGTINDEPIMIEEYAMFHRDKWEEVPE